MQNDSPDAVAEVASEESLNARLKKIGLKESYASHLATGRRIPSLDLALEIESKLGIPPAEWVERSAAFKKREAAKAKAEASQ